MDFGKLKTLAECMPGDMLGHRLDPPQSWETVVAVGHDREGKRVVLSKGGLFDTEAPRRKRRCWAVRLGIRPDGTAAGGCCLFRVDPKRRKVAEAEARDCFARYTIGQE